VEQEEIQEEAKEEKLLTIKKENLEMKKDLASVINQSHLVLEDQAHHQEMERKKVLVIKENLALLKR